MENGIDEKFDRLESFLESITEDLKMSVAKPIERYGAKLEENTNATKELNKTINQFLLTSTRSLPVSDVIKIIGWIVFIIILAVGGVTAIQEFKTTP